MHLGPYLLRKVISLTAALSLVLHALLLASAVSPKPRTQAAASLIHVHAGSPDHDRGPAPADNQQNSHDLRFCCILCSKLGTAIGPSPVPLSLPVLRLVASTIRFAQDHQTLSRVASVLPVGARAPPVPG
ncbi:DUF2946 family protein [Microvirga sp. VF16]|uniref:DUF2946 family protein n=1 Tax=Microvirga sp. VF16 TaxID=2807101 RepID=UPI00353044F5